MKTNRYSLFNRIRKAGLLEVMSKLIQLGIEYLFFLCHKTSPCQTGSRYRDPLGKIKCTSLPASFNTDQEIFLLDRFIPADYPKIWKHDPVTGYQFPDIWGKSYLLGKMYKHAKIKYTRTVNRFNHAISFAYFSPDELGDQLLSWIDENKYLYGINWSDSLDIGVRLIHWSIALRYMTDSVSKESMEIISKSVSNQASFIKRNLSEGSSANNHLIGELFGLFVSYASFPELKNSHTLLSYAQRRIEEEFSKQFFNDGMNREQTISYLRWLLEYGCIVAIIGEQNNKPFSDHFLSTLNKGALFLSENINYNGEINLFGDCGMESSTDLLAISFQTINIFQSTINLIAHFTKDKQLIGRATPMTSREAALLSPLLEDNFSCNNQKPRISSIYRESGYAFLRCGNGIKNDFSIAFKAGNMGFPGTCAHAHADQLSFTLSCMGKQILVDPGSYTYYTWGLEARRFFRGTQAHNTVFIDGLDQAEYGGPMLWMTQAEGRIISFKNNECMCRVRGEHTGYKRLYDPVSHVREIKLDKIKKYIKLTDSLISKKPHSFELNFLFHPNCHVTAEKNGFRIIREDVSLFIQLEGKMNVQLRKGDETSYRGWYSPAFGEKKSCFYLSGQTTQSSLSHTTMIKFYNQR